MDLKQYLKIQEGSVKNGNIHRPYRCPSGALTIGYGHNLDANGISEGVADLLLDQDLGACRQSARRLVSNFDELNEVRQCVILSLIFQLGEGGFSQFQKARAHVERGSFRLAAAELTDSKWYRDQKRWANGKWTRADRECEMMRTGEWVSR